MLKELPEADGGGLEGAEAEHPVLHGYWSHLLVAREVFVPSLTSTW